MKIRYCSDLHLEFWPAPTELLAGIGEEVVVLAGDIDVGVYGIVWAKRYLADRPVIYVIGNHEMYHGHWDRFLDKCRAEARGSNVTFLENDAVVIGGVRFLGCSLWTDFQSGGEALANHSMAVAARRMADFQLIASGVPGGGRVLTPNDTVMRHHKSVAWIEQAIDQSKEPVVVVTHHGPSLLGCSAQHAGDVLTPAFLNDRTDLLRAPVRAWIFGHTHHSGRWKLNNVDLVSNQRGYPSEGTAFDPYAMIEVQP